MPKLKYHVFICTNDRGAGNPKGSCCEKGSENILSAMKASIREHGLSSSVRANKSGCLDCCKSGPAMVVYPDAIWYEKVKEDDVKEIVESHLKNGVPLERLIMKN